MQYANELFFLILAIALWGLALGGRSLISIREIIQPEGYWFLALICSASAFTCFASASFIYIGLLTPANTFLLAGYIYLASYFRSLSQPLSKQFKYLVILVILLFGLAFQYLMQNGTFVQRVSLVVVFANLALIWQLIELLRLHKLHINLPIFVIVTIAAEIVLATSRLIMLIYFDTQSNIHLYQEQFLTTLVRWIWFTFTMLSYVAVIGYSLKKITIENIKTTRDNQKITELLKEKEALIASLLKANITSTTGALSASIAHELNQPLCASNLNIQFLQSKMGKNELSSELGAKVLASLQSDNQRAADILRSLRAIFLEAKIDAKTSDINELVESILVIIRPELKENNITLNLNLCDFKNISMNRVEIQQVILNLLNNAIQALASLEMTNKVITLSSVIHSDALRLSVADNGKGVAENLQNNLFELLGSSKQVGMGLGLWLCKHIVTRHGGRIWYENTQSGGANFIMELPTKIYD